MNHHYRVRLFCCSLIFSFWLIACRDNSDGEIILGWEKDWVKTIMIPEELVDRKAPDELNGHLRISLAQDGAPSIIGEMRQVDDYVVFTPAIPFTRGLKYWVSYEGRRLKEIVIPAAPGKAAPTVTAIYPMEDSLPENLLKIYIGFSQQMQEGVSARHIYLVKNGTDTLKNVFLDLQPELWNQDRTMLTLWLNPGRIKRDLIPNREEGPPLIAGERYEILIKPGWHDAFGDSLRVDFKKEFVTVARDTTSPDFSKWKVTIPVAGSTDPLIVHFAEPLDYLVAKNALFIANDAKHELPGNIELTDSERTWRFTPFAPWKKGQYELRIEPRVEDLAGNNMERLFDVDLEKQSLNGEFVSSSGIYSRGFEVK